MAPVDVLAILVGFTTLLWLDPPQVRNPISRVKPKVADELELLLTLQAGLHSAQSFFDLVAALDLKRRLQTDVWQRVAQIGELSRAAGLSASLLIAQLVTELQNHQQLLNKWREQMAAAITASWLLFLIPFPLLFVAAGSGLAITDWILNHPIGRATFLAGLALSSFSLQRVIRARPENSPDKTVLPKLNSKTAALASGFAGFVLLFNFWGVLLGGILAILTYRNWHRFDAIAEISKAARLAAQKPRVVTELATALSVGLDWKSAVQIVVLPEEFRAEWQDIHQRIAWGVSVPAAFAGTNWNQIAVVVDQALRSGAPISAALFELANHWQRTSLAEQLADVERRAGRYVVFVTFLQLPAFILMGLVPLVAASIFPLVDTFSR
ncbi:MAG: hypothetical protein RL038_653 [Actinomycetota bacterium]